MRHNSHTLCTDARWVGKSDCSHCGVKNKVLFSGIEPGYLSGMLRPIDNILFEPYATLFRKEEAGAFVYTIRSGRVKLVRPLDWGGERIVRLLSQGDVVGLEAWLGMSYQNTAIALQQVDVCRIPVSVLKSIDEDMPQLSGQLQQKWEAALEQAEFWIAQLSTGPMKCRVACLIRFLVDSSASDKPGFTLLKAEDMADALGSSRETITRLMAELKHTGVLTRVAPKTYVCDLDALDRYARSA